MPIDKKELVKRNKKDFVFRKNWIRPGKVETFDTTYEIPGLDLIQNWLGQVSSELRMIGLDPFVNYGENNRDCDNFATWIFSGITQRWAMLYDEIGGHPSITFGWAFGMTKEGLHAFNTLISKNGSFIVDYGQLRPPQGYEIYRVKYE